MYWPAIASNRTIKNTLILGKRLLFRTHVHQKFASEMRQSPVVSGLWVDLYNTCQSLVSPVYAQRTPHKFLHKKDLRR